MHAIIYTYVIEPCIESGLDVRNMCRQLEMSKTRTIPIYYYNTGACTNRIIGQQDNLHMLSRFRLMILLLGIETLSFIFSLKQFSKVIE